MEKKNIAAIYCRLSEEDRNKKNETQDSESIINQIMILTRYAENAGWEVYDCYTDDDWTGADRTRPAFNRLLQDAENGKFNIVLCKTQSRFTRELELVEKYIHGLFPVWGIRFVSIVDNADSAVKGNKKSRQINGLVNEWYLEDMSENIRAVLDARRKEGYYIGSTALYGYRKDPEQKGHLVIDPEAAEVVRLVFNSFANGMGKSAIARMLNEKGIPNPTEYKRQKGITYKTPKHKLGTLWKYFAIADMLINEMYIGNLVQGKYGSVSYKTHKNKPKSKENWIRVEHTHEAIIDRELWNRVQKLIREKAHPFDTGEIGIFACKVHCRHCGYVMRSSKNHGKHYLRCTTKMISKESCQGSFISVEKLEGIVLEELRNMNEAYLDQEILENEVILNHNLGERRKQLEKLRSRAQRKEEQANQAIKNLYLDKVKGIIDMERFNMLSEELESDAKCEKSRAEEYMRQIEELEKQEQKQADKKIIVEGYVNAEHLNRAIVEELIDYIEVSKRDSESKLVNVNIHWNF